MFKAIVQEYDLKKEYFQDIADEQLNYTMRDSMGKSRPLIKHVF